MLVRITALAGLALIAGSYLAADDKKKSGPDAGQMAAMEAMMKHSMPGEHHKALQAFVGNWTYTGTYYMGGEKIPLTGSAERKLLMEGRYLHDHVRGDSPQPFEGLGWTGYDNHTKKYFSTWIDSMTTSLMRAEGDYDPKTRTFTMISEVFDAGAGKVQKGKDVCVIKSADEMHQVMYKLVDGKEEKVMEFHYKRKK